MSKKSFEGALQDLLNMYSQENISNTPDYILRQFVVDSLRSFNTAVQQRESHFGRDGSPIIPAGMVVVDEHMQKTEQVARQLNKMQVKYEEMSQAEYESSMRSYIEELDYILGGLTGQPQTEEHNQQWLEARQSIINLIVKSIGKDEKVDSTDNHTYGPKSVRNRQRQDLRTKWTLKEEE